MDIILLISLTAGSRSIGLIVVWGVGHENVAMDLDLKVSTPTWVGHFGGLPHRVFTAVSQSAGE